MTRFGIDNLCDKMVLRKIFKDVRITYLKCLPYLSAISILRVRLTFILDEYIDLHLQEWPGARGVRTLQLQLRPSTPSSACSGS